MEMSFDEGKEKGWEVRRKFLKKRSKNFKLDEKVHNCDQCDSKCKAKQDLMCKRKYIMLRTQLRNVICVRTLLIQKRICWNIYRVNMKRVEEINAEDVMKTFLQRKGSKSTGVQYIKETLQSMLRKFYF